MKPGAKTLATALAVALPWVVIVAVVWMFRHFKH